MLLLLANSTVASAQFHLFDHQWQAEGTWGDGSTFKQEISFEYQLDSAIIVVRSKGFTDKEQNTYGLRNFGIRPISTSSDTSTFYEFDVFGGLTEGLMIQDGKDLYYQYQYGGTTVTDYWQYQDDSTYHFTVGDYQDGIWKQKYLECAFHQVKKSKHELAFDRLKSHWQGKWIGKSKMGVFTDDWTMPNGHELVHKSTIGDGKGDHSFTGKIELFNDQLIWIMGKGADLKLYTLVDFNDEILTFKHQQRQLQVTLKDRSYILTSSTSRSAASNSKKESFQIEYTRDH